MLYEDQLNYVSDRERLNNQMGQFQYWENKLFYWAGDFLGWRLI